MAGYNNNAIINYLNDDAISYEGGKVYNKTVAEDWTNCLMSMMVEDRCYETSNKQVQRYINLTEQMAAIYGNEFIAKASVFARNELGMRSIAQLTAAWLNNKTFDRKRSYFKNFCHRADDVAEVFAAIDMLGQKRSHATVRGCGDYLATLGEYTMDKYKMPGKKYNMYDCINICHVKSAAADKCVNHTLKSADTWEQKISAAKNEDEKAQEWCKMLTNGGFGYLALIRNIRNISNAIYRVSDYRYDKSESLFSILCDAIQNEDAIKKSLVFPYQIYCAYKAAENVIGFDVADALSKAFITSVSNMPQLPGRNAILLDVSGSMEDRISRNSSMTIKEVGAVYAAAIALMNPTNTTYIKFGTEAQKYDFNYDLNIFAMIEDMAENDDLGYGTHISPAFAELDGKYDRIFIISDMQIMGCCGWVSNGINDYASYKKKYGAAKVYSFDLGNYATQVANPSDKDVKLFTTMSSKVFDFITLAESGISIVGYINNNCSY